MILLVLATPLVLAYVAWAYDLRPRVSSLLAYTTRESEEQPLTGLDKEAEADEADGLGVNLNEFADVDAPISSTSLMPVMAQHSAHFPEGDPRLR